MNETFLTDEEIINTAADMNFERIHEDMQKTSGQLDSSAVSTGSANNEQTVSDAAQNTYDSFASDHFQKIEDKSQEDKRLKLLKQRANSADTLSKVKFVHTKVAELRERGEDSLADSLAQEISPSEQSFFNIIEENKDLQDQPDRLVEALTASATYHKNRDPELVALLNREIRRILAERFNNSVNDIPRVNTSAQIGQYADDAEATRSEWEQNAKDFSSSRVPQNSAIGRLTNYFEQRATGYKPTDLGVKPKKRR